MEIELKYHIDNQETADAIFDSEEIKAIIDTNSEERIPMRAVYFDTEDKRLSRELMAFRVRREGNHIVATLKWNGQSEDGMHIREELNVPVRDESKMELPDVEIFASTPMYEELKTIIGDRTLFKVVEIEVLRRQARIDTGKAICEISYDYGKVFHEGVEGVISEMEIELYSGEKEDMERLGDELALRYGLVPENRSKFKQGIELAKNNQ